MEDEGTILAQLMDDMLRESVPQELARAYHEEKQRQQQQQAPSGRRRTSPLTLLRQAQMMRVLHLARPDLHELLLLHDTACKQVLSDGSLHPRLQTRMLSAAGNATLPSAPIWENIPLLRSAAAVSGRRLAACAPALLRRAELYPATDPAIETTIAICERPYLKGVQDALRAQLASEVQRLHDAEAGRIDDLVDSHSRKLVPVPDVLSNQARGRLHPAAYNRQRRLLAGVRQRRMEMLSGSRAAVLHSPASGVVVKEGDEEVVVQVGRSEGAAFLEQLCAAGHVSDVLRTTAFCFDKKTTTLGSELSQNADNTEFSATSLELAVDALCATLKGEASSHACEEHRAHLTSLHVNAKNVQDVLDTALFRVEKAQKEEEEQKKK